MRNKEPFLPTEPEDRKIAVRMLWLGFLICLLAIIVALCTAFPAVLLNTSYYRTMNDKYQLQQAAGLDSFDGYLKLYTYATKLMDGKNPDMTDLHVSVNGASVQAFSQQELSYLTIWRHVITAMKVLRWALLAVIVLLVIQVALKHGKFGMKFVAFSGFYSFLGLFAFLASLSYYINFNAFACHTGLLSFVLGSVYFANFYNAFRIFAAFMLVGPLLLELLLLRLAAKKNHTEEDDYLYQ